MNAANSTPNRGAIAILTRCFLAVATIFLASGCDPLVPLVWLPDSSGFIYTSGDGISSVHHYDVLRGNWRTIVSDSQSFTTVPGLSPDGKKIALAQLKLGKTDQLRILIYDLSGTLVQMTDSVIWNQFGYYSGSLAKYAPCQVYWSPNSSHLLISHSGVDRGGIGIFDLDTRGLRMCDKNVSLSEFVLQPIRPDGAGFIATETVDTTTNIVFCKWNGTMTRLGDIKQIADPTQPLNDKWCDFTWHNATLVAHNSAAKVEIDTGAGKITKTAFKHPCFAATSLENGSLFTEGRAALRTIKTGADDKPSFRLEYFNKNDFAPTLVAKDLPFPPALVPSPDRAFTGFRFQFSPTHHPEIGITRENGALLTQFHHHAHQATLKGAPKDPRRTTLPNGYVMLGKHMTDSLLDPDRPVVKKTYVEAIAECNAALLDISGIESDDREIRFVAKEGTDSLKAFLESLRRSSKLPRPPSSEAQFAEGFVMGLFGQFDEAMRVNAKYRKETDDLLAEARNMRSSFQQLRAATLLLPRIAAMHAGPKVTNGQALTVSEFRPRWGPFSVSDVIALQNNMKAGEVLHNCTILVEVIGDGGASAKNVHYVSEWKAGRNIYAKYLPGSNFGDGAIVGQQTVNRVQQIRVSLWCDELHQTITVPFSTQMFSSVAYNCSKDLKLDIRFRPFAKGMFSNDERGITVSFSGLVYVPKCKVGVTFSTRQGLSQSVVFESTDWESFSRVFADRRFTFDPDTISVVLSFTDPDFSLYYSVNR